MKPAFPPILLFSALLALYSPLLSCKDASKNDSMNPLHDPTAIDAHSYARPEAAIQHFSLELTVDFAARKLHGTASYKIKVKEGTDSIWLDTKGLDISQVTVDGKETPFHLGTEKEWLGQPLSIPVNQEAENISIKYSTRPEAEALQWLLPSQTSGKQQPYLFTQGQAILTRSWIPIQDSPGIRFTYDATITTPVELMAVMSATNPQKKNPDGVYTFKMEQPIPAYLIALAVGDLDFKPIGKRTGVYSEPSMVNMAANEFVDMEKMVEAAEALYGPYQWERYDVIVLPPSFPFGGMENPRLTFATPTILAGDRSLVALIAHELAHSWSGNLVTNATWNDFWLNEGFTVYFELRIMEALYGKSYSDMLRILGRQSLDGTIAELKPEDTHLLLDLNGRNPDDGMNDVAYEKGALLLTLLEQKAGREKFDAFLRKYFDSHAFQSMTTKRFTEYLNKELLEPNKLDINLDEWINGPGLPANCPIFTSDRFIKVEEQANSFLRGQAAKTLAVKDWSTHEWLHFILALPDSLTTAQMKDLDTSFGFTKSSNSEIQDAWYKLAIHQGYGKEILPSIRHFLVNVGRRKFLTPLYTAMIDKGMKQEAADIFKEARPNYHSVSFNTIQALFDREP